MYVSLATLLRTFKGSGKRHSFPTIAEGSPVGYQVIKFDFGDLIVILWGVCRNAYFSMRLCYVRSSCYRTSSYNRGL